ncbi:MAG: asparagine synthase (glutamine-hydrolyzing) [Candidatus Omnitrophota bacterium]
MCGIAGIVDTKNFRIDESLIKNMCSVLKHRGPNDEGVYIKQGNNSHEISVALGHRRLSIIDLSESGRQPMCNEDRSIWLVCNGEIYNFLELRKGLEKLGHRFCSNTDIEVIIHLYEEEGEDCVKKLSGMFSFAIWDERQQRLMLARDRVGKKPLLYSFADNRIFTFASEFNSLLQNPLIERKIDLKAIHYYLTYLCVPAPMTAFEDIKKLLPAHILILEKGKILTKKYWNLDFNNKINISEAEASEEIARLLKEAVSMRLVSDVPLGAFLSGGVDSSIVVSLMSQLLTKPVETFSIGFEEKGYNELPYAKIIAKHFHTKHHEFIVKPNAIEILPKLIEHYGEPFADSSNIPTFYLSQLTQNHVTVVLNGDGGDELFAGYKHHLANYLADYYYRLPGFLRTQIVNRFITFFPRNVSRQSKIGHIRRFIEAGNLTRGKRYQRWVGVFSEEFKRKIYSDKLNSEMQGIDSSDILTDQFKNAEHLDAVDSSLFVDTSLYLPNDLLVKMDIATMSNSLEARSPFLDHHLMEFAARLPSRMKIRMLTSKYILRKTFKNLVPNENIKRDKMGFALPIGVWLKGQLRNFVKDTLLSDKSLKRGYFKPEEITKLIDDHISGKADYAHHLWSLLILELWHQRFIDNV